MQSDLKNLDITYAEIRLMREILVAEMRSEITNIGIEAMKLIEMRIQTLIMAGITRTKLEIERKNFR